MNKRRIFLFAVLFIVSLLSASADVYKEEDASNSSSQSTVTKQESQTEALDKVKAFVPQVYDSRLLASSTVDYPSTPGDVYQLSYMANNQMLTTQISLDALYTLRVHNLGTLNARGKTFLQLKTEVESLVSKNYPLSGVQFSLTTPGSFFITLQGSHPNPGQKTATGLTRLSDILYELNLDEYPWASLRDIKIISTDNQIRTFDFYQVIKTGDIKNNPRVRPGDTILVSRTQLYIKILGQIHEAGTYQLLETEGASDLIEKFASGLKPSADTEHIQLFRVSTPGKEPGLFKVLSYENLISERLENGDEINVPNKQELKHVFTVEGAVNGGNATDLQVSGRYTYRFFTGQKLSDVFKSQDLVVSLAADYENSYFIRNGNSTTIDIGKFLFSTDLSQDRELKDGDILVIPFKYNYVWITGAVSSPGRYPVQAGKKSDYYINLAGGYNINSVIGKEKIYNAKGEKMTKEYILEPESRIDVPSTWFMSFINTYWGHLNLIWGIIGGSIVIVTTILEWIKPPDPVVN